MAPRGHAGRCAQSRRPDSTHDAVGNRTVATSGSLSESFAYSLNGDLTSGTGNLLGAWSGLTYDDENRLTSIASYPPSGGTESFVYNAFGQRMQATRTGFQCDYYTYAGERVLQESCPTGVNTQGLYALENGSYYSPLAAADRCCLPYPRYPVYDAMGNIHDLVDQNGAETDRYLLDAGACPERSEGAAIWATFESVWNFYRYGGAWGYITDSPGAGLIQLGARFYWPAIGRFVQQDPAKEGMNWYAYVGDNPVVWADPQGLSAWGVSCSATAELGTLGWLNGVANLEAGGMTFNRPNGNPFLPNLGLYGSGAAFVQAGPHGLSTTGTGGRVMGGYAGLSGNLICTNAGDVSQLGGIFHNIGISTPFGSLRFGVSNNGVFLGSIGFGPGTGYAVSAYDTNTFLMAHYSYPVQYTF